MSNLQPSAGTPENPRIPPIVFWILWAAFLVGVVIFANVLDGPKPRAEAGGSKIWLACLIPMLASLVLRWMVLPRMRTAIDAFRIFVLGIAFAEGLTFFGIFVFPERRIELITLSVLGIVQFAPFFASRYSDPGNGPDADSLRQQP